MTRGSVAALVSGGALIVIVNAAILGTARSNREGERLAELTLTERELAVPAYREAESSSLRLKLKFASESPPALQRVAWRKQADLPAVDYPWLDRGKLESLGFRLDSNSNPGLRIAFVALELDGDSWTRWLAAREDRLRKRLPPDDAEAVLALDRSMRSRLVPVDAGRDVAALRRRFPDRARYLIVPGLVRAVSGGPDAPDASWRGQITDILVSDIGVPREMAPVVNEFWPRETTSEAFSKEKREQQVSWPAATPPRYRGVVVFGQRNEPWLVSVSEIGAN
jgi:hypothetical protein